MIQIKFGGKISEVTFRDYCCKYLVNRTFKILGLYEDGCEWQSYVNSFVAELIGSNELLVDNPVFFSLISQIQGMLSISTHEQLRKEVLSCCNYIKKIPDQINID